ncbi:MAG TPA: ABC transporter permease, partial [Ilumatobacteraceae bacterium]|nr:ABC transporter permease [Ilumatobacteraceae bacterium]
MVDPGPAHQAAATSERPSEVQAELRRARSSSGWWRRSQPDPLITQPARGLWGNAFRQLIRKKSAIVGMAMLSVLVFTAVFAPMLAPFDPNEVLLGNGVTPRNPPCINLFGCEGPQHILGTDGNGRDEFSRILFGARVSLAAGLGAVVFAVIIGTAIGLIAGFYGRWVDSVLMRFMDVLLAFPSLLLAI